MTEIYLVRHCEAMGNLKRLFQGSTDCDVSETGKIQLGFLEKRFENIHLDAIYSSPLKRAFKTAEAIRGNKNINIETKSGLREICGGIYEGKPFRETFLAVPGLADIWNNHPQDFAPPEGEPMREAYERIYETIKEIVKKNPDKTVACASHGGIIRCLMCKLMFNDIERLSEVAWSENTSVTLLKFYPDMNFEIEFYNDHSHVPDAYMPKRNRIVDFVMDEDKK